MTKDSILYGLFQDSEPEEGDHPPRRGLPLISAQRDDILPDPTAAVSWIPVPEFGAVGILQQHPFGQISRVAETAESG